MREKRACIEFDVQEIFLYLGIIFVVGFIVLLFYYIFLKFLLIIVYSCLIVVYFWIFKGQIYNGIDNYSSLLQGNNYFFSILFLVYVWVLRKRFLCFDVKKLGVC